MKLTIVSGLSGSGKSTCMNVLEDIGYYCVDNLPISFVSQFIEFCKIESKIKHLALSVDIRSIGVTDQFIASIKNIKKNYTSVDIIFTQASSAVLIRRYSESRRPHPYPGESLEESILSEMKILSLIKNLSDIVIDTSRTNIHELKSLVKKHVGSSAKTNKININIISFGYKYGIPLESDLVLDVRFLANPFFIEGLKNLTGIDKPVIKYLSGVRETRSLFKKFSGLLNFLLNQYTKEGRSTLTISIGCTGGKHRSVFIAEKIKKHLRKRHPLLNLKHRDIRK